MVTLTLAAAVLCGAGFGVRALFFTPEEKVALTGMTTYGSLSTTIEGTGIAMPADSFSVTAASSEGKIAGVQSLKEVTGVSRSAFDGEDYVVLEGVRVPIAEDLQVYNGDNDSWIDLAGAKGYADTLRVYYSGTLGRDAKVRVIAVGG